MRVMILICLGLHLNVSSIATVKRYTDRQADRLTDRPGSGGKTETDSHVLSIHVYTHESDGTDMLGTTLNMSSIATVKSYTDRQTDRQTDLAVEVRLSLVVLSIYVHDSDGIDILGATLNT